MCNLLGVCAAQRERERLQGGTVSSRLGACVWLLKPNNFHRIELPMVFPSVDMCCFAKNENEQQLQQQQQDAQQQASKMVK